MPNKIRYHLVWIERNVPHIFSLNNQKIFDNVDFINKKLHYHSQYYKSHIPNHIDNKIIEIGGWKINTQATIHHEATTKKTIENFETTERMLKISFKDFFQPFILIDIIRHKERGDVDLNVVSEPCVILYLRFCYWYGECARKYNMDLKNKEIRNKVMPKNPINTIAK